MMMAKPNSGEKRQCHAGDVEAAAAHVERQGEPGKSKHDRCAGFPGKSLPT